MYAVGQCGLSITRGVPIYQAFYQALQDKGTAGKAHQSVYMQDSGFMHLANLGSRDRDREVSEAARF